MARIDGQWAIYAGMTAVIEVVDIKNPLIVVLNKADSHRLVAVSLTNLGILPLPLRDDVSFLVTLNAIL